MQNWCFFLFIFLLFTFGQAQSDSTKVRYDKRDLDPVEISNEDLAPYLNDESFNYELEKVDNSWWQGIKNWFYNILRSFFEWLFGVDAAPDYIAFFLKYLPYVLLGLLLFLLIRFLINANTKNILFSKENKNMVILSEEERLIKTEDIQALIQDAVKQKDYRLAIRYYYLFLLKLLTEKELIEWQLQKTNDDYISELSESNIQPLFKKVTVLYDYIWYGEFKIDEERYQHAKSSFDSLKNSIATNV